MKTNPSSLLSRSRAQPLSSPPFLSFPRWSPVFPPLGPLADSRARPKLGSNQAAPSLLSFPLGPLSRVGTDSSASPVDRPVPRR